MAKHWTGLATDLDLEGVTGEPYPTGLMASISGVSSGAGGRAEVKKPNRSSSRVFFKALSAAGFVFVVSTLLMSPKSRSTAEVEDKADAQSASDAVPTKDDFTAPAAKELVEPKRKRERHAQDAAAPALASGDEAREVAGGTLSMEVTPPLKRHATAKHAPPAMQAPADTPAQPESEVTTSKSVDTATYRELSGRY